jgi:murein DD-endopeptidase MepM/ murein hydrolase activator NlpD
MDTSRARPHRSRVHVGVRVVVLGLLLVALLSLVRPAGALGSPVDPVPVGVWPLVPTPQVVRGFDPPDDPWGAGHRGVDLGGAVGQRVRTALAGRVTFAGLLAGRGVVVVDHGDTRTTYEPVAATVHAGDLLPRGGDIGTLQLAGSHCFPRACLHWGWLRGDTYLDPLLLVGGGPVRLLPLWRDQPVESALPSMPYAALLTALGSPPSAGARRSSATPLPRASPRPWAMRPVLR